ncbi:S-adenosyl-L-methionine-dependent methyltransferase [Thamnocephalis sphaerospora]|uniref:rRNA adenine N(6)-methyltransferase n=1 Tax=Thamnocephalis sphaerospora TaxID=78915 RepID=A0A4P9XP76_9FUNG|nr:S-adenosyl-L-methionine-dependent methyltransferase [Thamnocephalis sphaerospora]|eukprot:RKP07797.1 S-adenosyl-L-methionine-dependent methyltransferase [Thamnocephalis sphaerospora]
MSPASLVRAALPRLPAVRDLVRIYGLNAKSELSQNFILDKNVTDKILRSAKLPLEKALVVEVGPGPGLLTRSILDAGAERLQLADACTPGRVHIIHGDVLKTEHETVLAKAFASQEERGKLGVHLLGNLPFNIASPLLVSWLHAAEAKRGLFGLRSSAAAMTLMFQKEVAERIVAPPDTRERSRLSVMAQTICHTQITYEVPPTVFVPMPKVAASVVQLLPRTKPMLEHGKSWKPPYIYHEDLVRHVFTKRRKSMRHILRHVIKDNPDRADVLLQDAGVPSGNTRPAELATEAFCQLTELCYAEGIKVPR